MDTWSQCTNYCGRNIIFNINATHMMAFCWAWKIQWNGHYLCYEEIFSFICKQQLSLLLLLTFIYYPLTFIEYCLYLRNKNKLFKYISSFSLLNSVYYYSHFTDNKIEALRGQIYCQGSQSWMAMILIIDLLALKTMFLTLPYIVFLNIIKSSEIWGCFCVQDIV